MLVTAIVFVGHALFAQVRLPRLVRDSMVIQRDVPLKFWGWASKNERVTVNIQGKKYKTTAGNDGRWLVTINPLKAGGPHAIDIVASNTITLKNVLVGDVWLCAGQSNMVHYLDQHKERYADDIAKANYSEIRNFTVPTATNLQKSEADLPRGNWKSANPIDVQRFGVVAYFFARDLYERYHVPIGIINASVGGTPIEAWISEIGLKEFPNITATLQQNKDTAYVNSINRAALRANIAWNRRKVEDKGLTENIRWYDTTYVPKNWNTINVPGYWEDQGVRDLDGSVWYRHELDLPSTCKGRPAKIYLGRIVDADFLFVNGVLVGSTSYQYPQRRYDVPANVLKVGKNILVVRVLNNGGKGGFVPDKPYSLLVNNQSFDLKGYWQYKVGEVYEKRDPIRSIPAQNQPAALFNGMIAPLTNYAIKGILWYQGESNAGQPEIYQELLPALIQDWRKQWQQPSVPFLYVQLPNFMEVNYSPSESNWARLRESQRKALREPNTAMAVTIDLGEWNDIHPGNKKPIGDRLALAARALTYDEKNVVYSGPLFESARIEGQKIILNFSHVGGGLVTSDGEPLQQFAIAGLDKKFVWAKAVIENNTVVVWHDEITSPKFVRYAWADNPLGANLCNQEGLPASPFRTDD